ncbi:hypothetical protein JYT79_02675 [Cardiobacterium sp. AH-315-I02]|nr:hypothetical protein [Cardiobacterium sp. AH-315-I02]
MTQITKIITDLIDEGIAANAHFQIWWALRNLALPKYLNAMNNLKYVDFFHASNSGHYKLIFISLSKIYDLDPRTSGIKNLKAELRKAGNIKMADYVEKELSSYTSLVTKLSNIRNQTIGHNQISLERKEAYNRNGVTPDEIKELIDKTCCVINEVARDIGINNTIGDSDRFESATLKLLEELDGKKT